MEVSFVAINYNGENVLTYLLSLLKNQFNTKVDKVDGKGLSTNDFTTELKNKLDGIAENANNYTHPTYTAASSGLYKVTVDTLGHITSVTAVSKEDITGLGIPGSQPSVPTISTNIETDATSDIKTASPKAVKNYVDGRVSSTYKPAGSITFTNLPTPSADISGNVYNINTEFTTTTNFVEGAGNKYSAGTNVVIIEASSGVYKYDVLSGFVDLSDYTKTSDFVELNNTEVQAIWDAVFTS